MVTNKVRNGKIIHVYDDGSSPETKKPGKIVEKSTKKADDKKEDK